MTSRRWVPRHARRALRIVWQSAPRWTAANVAVVLVRGLLPLASLYLLKLIIDTVEASVGQGAPDLAYSRVAVLITIAAGVALLDGVLQALSAYLSEGQSRAVTDRVQGLIQAKSVTVDLAFYEDPRHQDTFHRAQQQGASCLTRVVAALIEIARSGLSLLAVGGFLLAYHWAVAIVLLAVAVPQGILRLRQNARVEAWQRTNTADERRAGYLHWLLTGDRSAREVRVFDLGTFLGDRHRALRSRLRAGRMQLAASRLGTDAVIHAVHTAAVFGSFAFMAFQTLAGACTLGTLVVFFQAVQRAQGYLQGVMQSFANLQENDLYLSDVFEFLDMEPAVVAPLEPKPVPNPMRTGISLDGVTFRYAGAARPALSDVSLTIRPGETVAFVGQNGSGKTTLVKLLCRFYDPAAGAVRIDGIDLREIDPASLRREISVIFQDYLWYHGLSAAENIGMGDHRAIGDREGIRRSAREADADSFIEPLPRGYDHVMGRMFEEGTDLSVGQWQRLALARAFFRRAQLVILDEPSSALDPKAEQEVFAHYRSLAAGRTTVLISHRLSNVRTADRIHVLEQGRIVESGSHEELLRNDGPYRALYEAQAGQYR